MKEIILEFPDEGVQARVELLEEEAPRVCAGVLAHLPLAGRLQHAIYSGSEVAFLVDSNVVLEMENQTTCVLPGDVGYYFLKGGTLKGFPETISEICIFYDRDVVPRMPDGPVPVSIFGRITSNFEAFARICHKMRLEGAKPFRIYLAEEVLHTEGRKTSKQGDSSGRR
jgi:hypothetical protein